MSESLRSSGALPRLGSTMPGSIGLPGGGGPCGDDGGGSGAGECGGSGAGERGGANDAAGEPRAAKAGVVLSTEDRALTRITPQPTLVQGAMHGARQLPLPPPARGCRGAGPGPDAGHAGTVGSSSGVSGVGEGGVGARRGLDEGTRAGAGGSARE
eukprot:327763-Chlamydomonas_euryale.AAC.8